MSTADGATDPGMPEKRAVAGFWTTTVPPRALTDCAPIAPSAPLPERTTATRFSVKTREAVSRRWSTEGIGATAPSVRRPTVWSVTSTSWPEGTT